VDECKPLPPTPAPSAAASTAPRQSRLARPTKQTFTGHRSVCVKRRFWLVHAHHVSALCLVCKLYLYKYFVLVQVHWSLVIWPKVKCVLVIWPVLQVKMPYYEQTRHLGLDERKQRKCQITGHHSNQ